MNIMKGKMRDSRGFSLVELIVVIAIIIILTAALVPNVVGYINKSRIAVAKKTAATVYTASMNYLYSEIGKGVTFEPDSTIDVTTLWSDDVQLLKEFTDYDTVEIRLDESGTVVKYVYYRDPAGIDADYPKGVSGKVSE